MDNKKKQINSPKFTLAGKELYVRVYPYPKGEFIGAFLFNNSKESITATVNFKSSSGGKFFKKKQSVLANGGWGIRKFLSHDVYKKWARENEDIFSLDVRVTLHVKSPGTWTTER